MRRSPTFLKFDCPVLQLAGGTRKDKHVPGTVQLVQQMVSAARVRGEGRLAPLSGEIRRRHVTKPVNGNVVQITWNNSCIAIRWVTALPIVHEPRWNHDGTTTE